MAAKKKTNVPERPASNDYDALVRAKFPAFAYLLDNPEIYGPEITALLRQAVQDGWDQNNDGGLANLTAGFRATPYYQQNSSDARSFDSLSDADKQVAVDTKLQEIRGIIGSAKIPTPVLNGLARDAARRNLSNKQLETLAFSTVFQSNRQGGYEFLPAVETALVSGDAEALKAKARKYYSTVSDRDIEDYLTGRRTEDDFDNLFRTKAKGAHPHLAAQIDAGLSVEDIASDYKVWAARVLEKPETEIDMTKPEYMESFSSMGDKGPRQMSLSEWITKLRTDDKYGWRYTKTANDQAKAVAYNLIQTFGRA
jgi:hypothetical protein